MVRALTREAKMGNWTMFENKAPGYFGAKRDATMAAWDEVFGAGNWKLGWVVGDKLVGYREACQLYEDAYYEFLKSQADLLEELVSTASDVYDDAPTNVHSGFDYEKQETNRTHIQDIALRNVIRRLERRFEGSHLVQIRFKDSHLSRCLTPGQVPFHRPELITLPDNLDLVYEKKWWNIGSVEDFYQLNKRLLIRR